VDDRVAVCVRVDDDVLELLEVAVADGVLDDVGVIVWVRVDVVDDVALRRVR
jgi:hypothetical protein